MYLEPVEPVIAYSAPAAAIQTAEISILTYNVRGLPWPVALGRGKALRAIGRELALLRREGRQPDVVLIQEGFRGEVADLVRESGYRYWARGPSRSDRAEGPSARLEGSRDPFRGEGLGKFTGAGLHVLSDAPILEIKNAPYRHCAGFDCLANKGAMLVRLSYEGVPSAIDVVNTHMNSRSASKAPPRRTLSAHNQQTRELTAFIREHREAENPMLVGGDFNVRNSPARYYFEALERPYTVVSEFCSRPNSGCGPGAPDVAAEPWLKSQDLQAFGDGAVRVQPVRAETLFGAQGPRARLSDHDGYLVRYRLSWSAATPVAYRPNPATEVRPQAGRWGVKVSWKR